MLFQHQLNSSQTQACRPAGRNLFVISSHTDTGRDNAVVLDELLNMFATCDHPLTVILCYYLYLLPYSGYVAVIAVTVTVAVASIEYYYV